MRRRLCALLVAAVVATGAVQSVADAIARAKAKGLSARVAAWTATEDERMRQALGGWYPMFAAVRDHVPPTAFVALAIPAAIKEPPLPRQAAALMLDRFDGLRAAIAPRILCPVDAEGLTNRRNNLFVNDRPVFVLDLLGSAYAGIREFTARPLELANVEPVAADANFALRRLRREP